MSERSAIKNPLDKEKKELTPAPEKIYSDEDKDYLNYLQQRLQYAREQHNQPWPQFNNRTLYQYYEENQKLANTNHLEPKKNEDDVVVSSGTIEQKLDSLLSHINNLNLEPSVYAFNKDNNKIVALGDAIEDVIHDTNIQDGADKAGIEEKRPIRQRELLKQGTVFVQEDWIRKWEKKKGKMSLTSGKFEGVEVPKGALELVFEGPSANLLYTPNVYLGDMTEFYMDDQPFVFVSVIKNYDVARTFFNKFENWKYVTKGPIPPTTGEVHDVPKTIFDNRWRLNELRQEQVEIIYYQDQPNDEFQIIINGVLMLPIGFPLSSVSPRGKYNIAKQAFRVLDNKFAYGGSFVSSGSVKEISHLMDEILKLFVLKFRKSITPAYANLSGRVINKKVLNPGRISMGIDPDFLQPIQGHEVKGITSGEIELLREFQQMLEDSTVSAQFTGKEGARQQTATEILEIQRQAKLTLGLTVLACILLERKLAYLRLYNILGNWFDPTGNKLNDAKEYVKRYRTTNRETNIDGEGVGERMVIPTDGELPTPEVIRELENMESKKKGMSVRKIFISPKELAAADITWYIQINQEERESSPFFKLLFRERLNDMLTLIQLGSVPNLDGIEEEYARMQGKPRNKLFRKGNIPSLENLAGGEAGINSPEQNQQANEGRSNNKGAPALAPEAIATG